MGYFLRNSLLLPVAISMLRMEYIEFSISGGIARIVFNRPEKYNAIHRAMAMEIQAALHELTKDKTVRVLLLTGKGKAFCAGQDLNEVVDPEGPALKEIVARHYNPIVRAIRDLPLPVVAAVNGVAAGAGANIALNCDIVVAKKSAVFIQAFSKIGLIPDSGGTWILPRLIGWQKALAVTMLADKINAEEAERMGMIYKWWEDDQFDEQVEALLIRLSQMPTYGLYLTKEAYRLSAQSNLEAQLQVEAHLQTLAGTSEDYREGVRAFLEKRKPQFKGQ